MIDISIIKNKKTLENISKFKINLEQFDSIVELRKEINRLRVRENYNKEYYRDYQRKKMEDPEYRTEINKKTLERYHIRKNKIGKKPVGRPRL
jgi:hypothetical protein